MPLLHNFASLFCFPGNYRNCLFYMENLQVFSALEDNTVSNSFSLERVTVHNVEGLHTIASSQEELSHGLPNYDCGEKHHRCLRIRMAIANRREKNGSSIAEWLLSSFLVQSPTQDSVRESGYSKWVTTKVQFRTGQTEAVVTMITVRERSASISPSVPLFFSKWLQRPTCILFQTKKKEVRKNDHFSVKKTRYPFLRGMDSSCSLLTATILRRKEAVNNAMIRWDGFWWSL